MRFILNKLLLLILLVLGACADEANQFPSIASLSSVDKDISFQIDEETKLPNNLCWFKDGDKEYLSFVNIYNRTEILIYDLKTGQLTNKIEFEREGPNGILEIYSHSIINFDSIYISCANEQLCLSDTSSQIKQRIPMPKLTDSSKVIAPLSPPTIINHQIYIPQNVNPQLGENYMGKSPLGVMIDTITHKVTATPLHYSNLYSNEDLMYATHGNRTQYIFDGNLFVYSYDILDSLYVLDSELSKIGSYYAKSRYIDEVRTHSNRNWDLNMVLRQTCETPSYGTVVYDKYRQVYYRFAYPETKIEKKDNALDVFREGRKVFSIIILDKDMHMIGETLFPEYSYNSNLFFVNKDGLYLCKTHSKRSDFDENVFCFQCFELIKKND